MFVYSILILLFVWEMDVLKQLVEWDGRDASVLIFNVSMLKIDDLDCSVALGTFVYNGSREIGSATPDAVVLSHLGRMIGCQIIEKTSDSLSIDKLVELLRSYIRTGVSWLEEMEKPHEKWRKYALDCLLRAENVYQKIGYEHLERLLLPHELEEAIDDIFESLIELYDEFHDEKYLKQLESLYHAFPLCFKSQTRQLNERLQQRADEIRTAGDLQGCREYLNKMLAVLDARDQATPDQQNDSIHFALAQTYYHEQQYTKALDTLSRTSKTTRTCHLMTKILAARNETDQALESLYMLMELDDFALALDATRVVVRQLQYSTTGLNVYRRLEQHFPIQKTKVQLDLIRELVMTNHRQLEQLALEYLTRVATDPMQYQDIFTAIVDLCAFQLNEKQYQKGYDWAEHGDPYATTSSEKSVLRRIQSRAAQLMGKSTRALELSYEALELNRCIESIFSAFRILIFEPSTSVTIDRLRQFIADVTIQPKYHVEMLGAFAKIAQQAGNTIVHCEILKQMAQDIAFENQKGNAVGLPFGTLLYELMGLIRKSRDQMILYGRMALATLHERPFQKFGPDSVIEGIQLLCFNLGVVKSDATAFQLAADLARDSNGKRDALLGYISCLSTQLMTLEMKDIESLRHAVLKCLKFNISNPKNLSMLVCLCELRLPDYDLNHILKQSKDFGAEIYKLYGDFLLHACQFQETKTKSVQDAKKCFQMALSQASSLEIPAIYQKLIQHAAFNRDDMKEYFENFETWMKTHPEVHVGNNQMHWMVAKAWNLGVSYHRSEHLTHAKQLLTMAINWSELIPSRIHPTLLAAQYQAIVQLH